MDKFWLIKIENDLFDVAKRLKEIDESYTVYYNAKTRRYEIHSRFGLELVVPFDRLDVRTLLHAQKTRLENRESLVKEIEENNERVEREQRENIIKEALNALEEQL